MTEDLRISMIQSHIIWEDREENLGYYGELLRRVSGRTDLAAKTILRPRSTAR